jgi:hypothetical protein
MAVGVAAVPVKTRDSGGPVRVSDQRRGSCERGLRPSGLEPTKEELAKPILHIFRHLFPRQVADEPAAPVIRPEVSPAGRALVEMQLDRASPVRIQPVLEVVEQEPDDVATRRGRSP